MGRNKPTNRHHLYPKHLNGANHPDNIKVMEIMKHRALHLLTDINGKATAPKEQLQIILGIMASCLTDEFKSDINEILTIDDDLYYYKKNIIY